MRSATSGAVVVATVLLLTTGCGSGTAKSAAVQTSTTLTAGTSVPPSSSIASAPTDPDAPASLPDPLTLNQDLYFEGLQITLKQATASPTVGEAGMVTVGIDAVIENIGLGGAQSSWGGTIEIDGIATQSWGGRERTETGREDEGHVDVRCGTRR